MCFPLSAESIRVSIFDARIFEKSYRLPFELSVQKGARTCSKKNTSVTIRTHSSLPSTQPLIPALLGFSAAIAGRLAGVEFCRARNLLGRTGDGVDGWSWSYVWKDPLNRLARRGAAVCVKRLLILWRD